MHATARAAAVALLITGWSAASWSKVQTSAGAEPSPAGAPAAPAAAPPQAASPHPETIVATYCVTCHNQRLRTAGLALDGVDIARPASNPEVWERVIDKLRARAMPPPGLPRPDAATYDAVARWLETELDRAWAENPNPGRINAVHRLNRTEYENAVRDLLALDVDVRSLLPGDETADGSFDNFADVLTISTAHLERYLSVARHVTRPAIGLPPPNPGLETFEVPLHVVQDDRQSEDLPFGSRGGIAIRRDFPVEGEYLIKVRLRRQYQDYIMGMGWPQQLDVRLDGALLKRFTVGGGAQGRPAAASYAGDGEPGFAGDPEWEIYMQTGGDAGLELRARIPAGPHVVGVSFVRELWEPEGLPQPLQRGRVLTNDQIYMDHAAVGAVQIGGPYAVSTPVKDTPSRRKIFVCEPRASDDERACAARILSRFARLAYRRPINEADLKTLLAFFDTGRGATPRANRGSGIREQGSRSPVPDPRSPADAVPQGSFDTGIQFALERVLVDPDFLLRVYRDPAGQKAGVDAYPLRDIDVASRLSFFLWGSVPDERLLNLAERAQLTRPPVLEQEVRRMLADPRALRALVGGFASQWLNLRRVEEVVVDPDRYPGYDESLLQAFKQETELFIDSTIREDRSVVDLLQADYTFVNERLARHYGIPGVNGSRFRRVTLPNPGQRGGLLGHGALLATTSYPDRTSPVLRGKWLLNNIFGLPIPPPPPGVDTNLPEAAAGAAPLTIRERLAQHRRDPSCASCHAIIDPLGFALEHFDVIGGWRTIDESGAPVDATGTTAGGAKVDGLPGLRALLLSQPEQFPRTVTEKLMAYALGRRLEHFDRPAVRRIVREAAGDRYRWSALVLGIVNSPSFLMRASGERP